MAESHMTYSYQRTENVDLYFTIIHHFSCTIDWNSFYWKCMSQLYTPMPVTDGLIHICLNIDQVKFWLITCDFPFFGLYVPHIFRGIYSDESTLLQKKYGTKP